MYVNVKGWTDTAVYTHLIVLSSSDLVQPSIERALFALLYKTGLFMFPGRCFLFMALM